MAESMKEIPLPKETTAHSEHETPKARSTKKTSGLKQATERLKREFALAEDRDDLDAFVQANEAIMNGVTALSSEMMAFGNRRVREFSERSESLVGCQDPEDAYRIQCDFAQKAAQQYLDQTNHLFAIIAKMTEDFMSPLQKHTRQTLRDLTKETPSRKRA